MSATSSNPIELFISYAREDKTDKEELIKHLHTLIDEKKISIWHDGEIIPGQEWNEAIIGHLIDRCIDRFTFHRSKCAPEKND